MICGLELHSSPFLDDPLALRPRLVFVHSLMGVGIRHGGHIDGAEWRTFTGVPGNNPFVCVCNCLLREVCNTRMCYRIERCESASVDVSELWAQDEYLHVLYIYVLVLFMYMIPKCIQYI